jgi:GAF domain-containing protein
MNYLRRLSPTYVSPNVEKQGGLSILREQILQAVLLVFTSLGAFAFISAVNDLQDSGNAGVLVVYIVLLAIVGSLTIFRNLPYGLRGHIAVTLLFTLAVSELFESGQLGEVRMILIAASALTAILFNYRNVIAALLSGQAIIMGVGIYVDLVDQPIGALANLSHGTHWITGSIMFIMLSSVISGAVVAIISGLDKNLARQSELSDRLEAERRTLEKRIQERTRSMTRSVNQMRAAADISKTISSLSNPEETLNTVVEMVKDRFNLYYVGIFLIDSTRQFAVLRSGTGEAGKQMLQNGHQLSIGGSSMIGWAVSQRRARIALDVGAEAVRFNNPHLPRTRSEIALPIITRDIVLGAMTIQSENPNAFDENDIAILQNIADSLAIALENDRLFTETSQALEEIRLLNREYIQRAWLNTIETQGAMIYDYENPATRSDDATTYSIQVPLTLREEVIGYMTLETDQPALTAEETVFIENATTQTAIALENARLLHETERQAVQEQKLNEMASRFSRAISVEEILKSATMEFGQLPSVVDVSVQLNPAGLETAKPENSSGKNGHTNGKERAQ